ncbi:125aa long hypothetical protein [Pyrococcus horikoshii OT3]|uniref:Uncharacterized protein n=1 Tax=Pyrococcus horikoshii (strain ATCC 700860 / DSM 12428 / JCM 9974 / NBRC 100139 / OT-3) TaxID=70601 RepID=O58164_PYRHO|nr:125aa long hypothetical protein [Pyrococcus horikoshii OT3]
MGLNPYNFTNLLLAFVPNFRASSRFSTRYSISSLKFFSNVSDEITIPTPSKILGISETLVDIMARAIAIASNSFAGSWPKEAYVFFWGIMYMSLATTAFGVSSKGTCPMKITLSPKSFFPSCAIF